LLLLVRLLWLLLQGEHASAGLTVAGIASTVETCTNIDDINANDGKTGVVLKNEIRDTGNLLG